VIILGKVIILPTNPPRKINDAAIRELPKRRRRWSWRKAWDNLLTLVGITATGLFLAYLALGWMLGVPW